jgi:PAS domain S-box-containing protein
LIRFPVSFTPSLLHLPLAASAAMLAALAVATWRQRASPVARVFFAVTMLTIAWIIIYSLDIATADLNAKIFLVALRAPVVASLPVMGLLLALYYTGHERWLTRTRLALLFVPVTLSFLLAVTSQQHPYWRTDYRVEMSAVPVLTYRPALGSYLNSLWGYSLVVVMVMLLFRAVRDAPALYMRRAGRMFTGLVISLVPHVLFDAGITPIPGYNLAPSLFGLSALFFFWGTVRERVLELIPTARSVVVDQLRDVVFVLDSQDRVVDANRAALEALGRTAEQAIGQPAARLLDAWGIDLESYRGRSAVQEELTGTSGQAGSGGARRVLDLSIAPIERSDGKGPHGRIVVLRDITERELAREAELAAAALDAERQAEERIRREIAELLHGRIQNQLLSLVFQLGEVEHLWRDAPPEVVAHLRSIRDNLDRIRDREVRIASHRLYPALLDMGLAPSLHMLGERYEMHFAIAYAVDPAFSALDTPLDNKLPMVLRETAYRVVEEALSNAQRHSGASRVEVSLSVAEGERDSVHITVADNGRGADPAWVKPRLGLRTVEARVRNLGGSWRLVTAPGEGASLSVELPLSAVPVSPPVPASGLSRR